MFVEFENLAMNLSGFLGQLNSSCTMEQCDTLRKQEDLLG